MQCAATAVQGWAVDYGPAHNADVDLRDSLPLHVHPYF
jgi:hypothetical protein